MSFFYEVLGLTLLGNQFPQKNYSKNLLNSSLFIYPPKLDYIFEVVQTKLFMVYLFELLCFVFSRQLLRKPEDELLNVNKERIIEKVQASVHS